MTLTAHPSPVRAWIEPLTIPTYPVGAPDPNPMFFETRNIQGARGNIYPHPFTDQLSSEKVDRQYEAVFLENEYLQLILLPEIGGRIFAGLDKTNGYDFFYRHKVIKPALIGVFGPWISGGVEFNWPQHHRPTTFDPVDYSIEEDEDGSATVWLGEHDPLNRTKGMVGVCLHPGAAFIETKVRLYNRTPIPQTFLWWQNAGVHIDEDYQVIFPPDVHYAVHHAKNPVISYPLAEGNYRGNVYEGQDVSYWANSYGATSFFAGESKYEFFGGYDHNRDAGVVHVADSGISPGKKFFTWGNGPFGHSWQKALMDETGEYLELMAGVYTDNQPDFTWIRPYETKTFSQYWFPVQGTGGIVNANIRAALNLTVRDGEARAAVYPVAPLAGARISLTYGGEVLLSESVDLAPGAAYTRSVRLPERSDGFDETGLLLRLLDASGDEVIRYQPEAPWDGELPEAYQAVEAPHEIGSVEALFLAGLHLEQYRHPARSPEPYWQEALERDPGHSASHIALGRARFRQGEFADAAAHFEAAVARLTRRNFNPYDGEAHYNLGLALQYQGRLDGARKAFAKAAWVNHWRAPSNYALAQIDCRRGDWGAALSHLDRALAVDPRSSKARDLKCAVLRRLERAEEAESLALETLSADPLDHWARFELAQASGGADQLENLKTRTRLDTQTFLDIAFDYAAAGLWAEAGDWLALLATTEPRYPMVAYALGYFAFQSGDTEAGEAWYQRGAADPVDYCFPWRLEEMIVLQDVLARHPEDGRAAYYLGNLLYDKKRYAEAVELWERAVEHEPDFAIPWRNLGLASYNRDGDIDQAINHYAKAWAADPEDPRLLLEFDQLYRRKGLLPEARLALLDAHPSVVDRRDDLVIERAALLNRLGQPEKVLEIALGRQFHAWEGGEGRIATQYANAHWLLGRNALEAGDAALALEHFSQGLNFPANLGVVPSFAETAHLRYCQALAHEALGQSQDARTVFERVAAVQGGMQAIFFRALALRKLGQHKEATTLLQELRQQAAKLAEEGPQFNYFFSGKPSPIFEDDLKVYNRPAFLTALGYANLGLGDREGARSAFMQALALAPSDLFAHEELRRIDI